MMKSIFLAEFALVLTFTACGSDDKSTLADAAVDSDATKSSDASVDAATVSELAFGGFVEATFQAYGDSNSIVGRSEFYSAYNVPDGEEDPNQPISQLTDDRCASIFGPSVQPEVEYLDIGAAFDFSASSTQYIQDRVIETSDDGSTRTTYTFSDPDAPKFQGGKLSVAMPEATPAAEYENILDLAESADFATTTPVFTPGEPYTYSWDTRENAHSVSIAIFRFSEEADLLDGCFCELVDDGSFELPEVCGANNPMGALFVATIHHVYKEEVAFAGKRLLIEALVGAQLDSVVAGPVDPLRLKSAPRAAAH